MSETLDAATERLNRALAALETKARDARARASVRDDDLFASPAEAPNDPELRAAAVQASEALGRAAEVLRDLIGEEG